MNIIARIGFGPVLLDFPYVYQLDGDKLMCTRTIPELNNQRCTGLIDYDIGFNNLVCNECGRKYNALDLEKEGSDIEIIKGGNVNMKVIIRKGNQIIEKNEGTDSIKRSSKREEVKGNNTIKVLFRGKERDISTSEQSDTPSMKTHEDIMKAREEIMNRQKNIKNNIVDVKCTDDEIEKIVSTKTETDKNTTHTNEKYNIEIPENEKQMFASDEEEVENEEVATSDLDDIDVLEEKYGYLEDEFEEENYEKITKETKRFY